jgi:Inner membrane protein YgaP-like, transmembrane domain
MGVKLKKNVGFVDRIFRIVVAFVIALLYYTGQITDTAAVLLGILAVILLLTSFLSFCPIYLPFKLSTAKKDK